MPDEIRFVRARAHAVQARALIRREQLGVRDVEQVFGDEPHVVRAGHPFPTIESLEIKRLTLRTFSRPVDLKRFDRREWMTSPNDVWFVPEYLHDISHTELLTPYQRTRRHARPP